VERTLQDGQPGRVVPEALFIPLLLLANEADHALDHDEEVKDFKELAHDEVQLKLMSVVERQLHQFFEFAHHDTLQDADALVSVEAGLLEKLEAFVETSEEEETVTNVVLGFDRCSEHPPVGGEGGHATVGRLLLVDCQGSFVRL